jgi:hypothetical protein
MQLAVVTKVPPLEDPGNLAAALDVLVETEQAGPENGYRGKREALPVHMMLALRRPVFQVGEILVLNEDGREAAGHGRKPSKWDVSVREVADLDEAVRVAREAIQAQEVGA